jgi:hypothetical protein
LALPALNLSNSDFSGAEFQSTLFSSVMFGVGLGQCISTVTNMNLSFNIMLAMDVSVHGRLVIRLFTKWCPLVVGGLKDMIALVALGVDFSVGSYVIHSPRDVPSQQHDFFWIYQIQIIPDCHQRCGLYSLIIQVIDTCPSGPKYTNMQPGTIG